MQRCKSLRAVYGTRRGSILPLLEYRRLFMLGIEMRQYGMIRRYREAVSADWYFLLGRFTIWWNKTVERCWFIFLLRQQGGVWWMNVFQTSSGWFRSMVGSRGRIGSCGFQIATNLPWKTDRRFLPLGEQKENLGQIREYRRWLAGYETAGFICLNVIFILLTGLSNIIMGIDGR